jgi:hypothetical protein
MAGVDRLARCMGTDETGAGDENIHCRLPPQNFRE